MKLLNATLLASALLAAPAFAALPSFDLPILTFPADQGTVSSQGGLTDVTTRKDQ